MSTVAIEVVDLSPVVVAGIETAEGVVEASPPLEIPLVLDETEQYLVADFPPLGLYLSAQTRQELSVMIEEDLDLLWRNIACASDQVLAPDARAVKTWLRARFRGGRHAA